MGASSRATRPVSVRFMSGRTSIAGDCPYYAGPRRMDSCPSKLPKRLLFLVQGAGLERRGGIDRVPSLDHLEDLPLPVDHERGPVGVVAVLHAVRLGRLALGI